MFVCACGQIGRSLRAIDGHPVGRNCRLNEAGDFELVESELETAPAEVEERSGNTTRYPKVNKDEVFKR